MAWLIALVVVPLAAFFQQYTLWLGSARLDTAPAEIRNSEAVSPPEVSDLVINAKYLVKFIHFIDEGTWDGDEPWAEELAAAAEDELAVEIMSELEPMAVSRTERVQLAIVAGELLGPEAALERLTALQAEVSPGGALAGDITWLRKLYTDGPHAVDPGARDSLIERHGWFGQLALSLDAPVSDPLRWSAVSGFKRIAAFELLADTGMVLSFLLGIVLIIILGIIAGKHGLRLHFEPPEPGGTVYLETFTLFAAGFVLFLALFLFLFGLHAEGTTTALVVMEVVTWGLFLTLLYPIVIAKMPIRRVMRDLGLHRGEGFFKEVWCGLVGHVAGIPITWMVAVIMVVIALVTDGGQSEAQGLEGYPIFESPAGDSWLYVWIGAASAIIWAPLLEEIMFRGALYRHLRSRWRVPLSALVSAAVFGMVHPYTTSGIVQVAFGGLVYAGLREWRGSLIAPITAHALHNGTIMFIQIGMLMIIE